MGEGVGAKRKRAETSTIGTSHGELKEEAVVIAHGSFHESSQTTDTTELDGDTKSKKTGRKSKWTWLLDTPDDKLDADHLALKQEVARRQKMDREAKKARRMRGGQAGQGSAQSAHDAAPVAADVLDAMQKIGGLDSKQAVAQTKATVMKILDPSPGAPSAPHNSLTVSQKHAAVSSLVAKLIMDLHAIHKRTKGGLPALRPASTVKMEQTSGLNVTAGMFADDALSVASDMPALVAINLPNCVLRAGDSGDAVIDLKKSMSELGLYSSANNHPYFGKDLQSSILQLKRDYALDNVQDPTYDLETRAVMKVLAVQKKVKIRKNSAGAQMAAASPSPCRME